MYWTLFAAVLFLTLVIYPYIIYPLILSFLPKRIYPATVEQQDNAPLSMTLVFCAYNEEASLPSKLANLRNLKHAYRDLKIFAYSDASIDKTNQMLREAADFLTPVIGAVRAGKASGMKELVDRCDTDIVVFTDANAIVDVDKFGNLEKYFYDESIGTVSGTLHYRSSDKQAVAKVGGAYWRLEEKIKKLESLTGSMMGADGAFFATRRTEYPTVPSHLLDDLIVSISPLFSGKRVVSAEDVVVYENLTTSSSEEFRRKARIACRAFNTHRYLHSKLRGLSAFDKWKYASHKLIRWFGAFNLVIGASFSLVFLLSALSMKNLVVLFLCLLVVSLLVRTVAPAVINSLWEVLRAMFATSLGLLYSLRGLTFQTWEPAKSRN